MGLMLPKGCSIKSIQSLQVREIFELAGFDYDKYDPACPQPWFEEKLKLGIKDHYGWYYGDARFGRPLSYQEVLLKLMDRMYIVVKEEKDGADE